MKRFFLILTLLATTTGNAFAVGETKGLGNIFGSAPADGSVVYASSLGVCDGVSDAGPALRSKFTDSSVSFLFVDTKAACVVSGTTRTFIDHPMYVGGIGGGGLKFTHPSATYLTVSGTQYVTIQNLTIAGADVSMTRTAWAALAAYNSANIRFDKNNIARVNGAGILLQNTRDSWATDNAVSNTLSDGIHVTNGSSTVPQTNCRNIHVTGNTVYKTGDDGLATVSYIGTGNPACDGIYLTDNTSISSTQAAFSNIGSRNVFMTGSARDAQGLNAVRVEEDLAYVTLKPENTYLGIIVENPSSTGVLVGRNAVNTTGWVDVSGTGLRHRVYVGSGASTNRALNTSLKVNLYGGNGPGVEANGASVIDLTGTIDRVGQYGVVAPDNVSDIDWDGSILNIGQASPTAYNAVHLVNAQRGHIKGECTDNQVTSTIANCVTLTNTVKVTSDMVGWISNTLTNVASVGTPSNTLAVDRLLRTSTVIYDPPMLVMGTYTSTTVTVAGAAAGDYAYATFTNALQGMTLEAEVLSADTVTVSFINPMLVTRDLASGTVRAFVRKRP